MGNTSNPSSPRRGLGRRMEILSGARRGTVDTEVTEHYAHPEDDEFNITNAYGAMAPWLAIHLAKPETAETPHSSSHFRRESLSNSFAKLRRASVIAAFERKDEEKERIRSEENARREKAEDQKRKSKSKSYLPSYMSVSPNGRMMFVQFSNHSGLFCFRISEQNLEFVPDASLAVCDSPHISWLGGVYATLVQRCPQDLEDSAVLESELRAYTEWKRRMDRRPYKAFNKADKKFCLQVRNITCTTDSESGVEPCMIITTQVPSNLFAYSESMRQLLIFRSRIRKGGDDFESVLIETENNTERSLDLDLHATDMMTSYPAVMAQCPNLQWAVFQGGIFQWRVIPRMFHRHASDVGTRSRHNSSSRRHSTSSTGGPTPFVNDCDPKIDLIFDTVDLFTFASDGERVPCQLFDRGEIRDVAVIEETENSCLISCIERRKKVKGVSSAASWLSVGRIYREQDDPARNGVEAIYEQLVSLKLHPFGGETLKCCWWTTRYLIFTLPDVTFASTSASEADYSDGGSSSSNPRFVYDSDLSDSFCDLFALDVSTHSETQLNFMLDLLGDEIEQNRDIARIVLNFSKIFIIQRCRLTTTVQTFQESQLDADALIQAHLRNGSPMSTTPPPAGAPKQFTIRSICCDSFGQTLTVETHDGEDAVFFVHYRPLGNTMFAVDSLFDSYIHWGHLFADIESDTYLK